MHTCRSKQIFGVAKDFCPNFPKLAQKVVVHLLPTDFLQHRSRRLFIVWLPKKEVFNLFFCKRRAPCFEVKQCWAPVLPRCSGICIDIQGYCPDFQRFCPNVQGFCPNLTNPNFCGCACIPCTPPSLCKWEETDKNTEHRIIETASFHLQSHDNFEGFFHSQQDTELHSNKGGSTQ